MIIKKAEYLISAVKKNNYPEAIGPEFVFVGRSNVGKSSFINALLNRKNLAFTSGKPGKTQTLNFFNINDSFMLVDVPGYGYASHQKSTRVNFGLMLDEYLKERCEVKYVFQIVDIRHKPTADDCLMFEYLKHLQSVSSKFEIILLATKLDKIGTTIVARHKKEITGTLGLTKDDKLILVSSESKKGIPEVHQLIEEALNHENH